MATKIFTVAILLFVAMATTFSTCKKGGFLGCSNSTYKFNDSCQAYPDKDSISIGDTIWVNYNFSTTFQDAVSNQVINFSEAANFSIFLSILQFTGGSISDPGTTYAAKKFTWKLIKGKAVQSKFPDEGNSYNFSETSNSYLLKVGIIPDSVGIYALAISDAAGVYRITETCPKADISFQYSNTDQHLYYYQNNRPGYQISDYERTHMYCFKVY